jgi:hypothetical protein
LRKKLFQFGVALILCASLLRAIASPASAYGMTFNEFIAVVVLGILMMLPGIAFLTFQFFTSGPRENEPE